VSIVKYKEFAEQTDSLNRIMPSLLHFCVYELVTVYKYLIIYVYGFNTVVTI